MLFHSIEFLLFFPIVVTAFFSAPKHIRGLVLLAASYYYYISWKPKYVIVLLFLTVFSYAVGLFLEKVSQPFLRRLLLFTGIAASIGMLVLFKYFNFLSQSLQNVLDTLGFSGSLPTLHFLLPLGISLYSLQVIRCLIDVYRGTIRAETSPWTYALFLSFFPQVTSGPIARPNHLLPQLHQYQRPDYENIVSGLLRMAWGFFKKLVIADRLAIIVNAVFGEPTSFSGLALILATYAFAFQILCDFSGYADIAIGAARVMGIQLGENFQQPYLARSIPEFWRRWHISLSNWLRDYIFYPLNRSLVRSRSGERSWLTLIIPPLVTMAISGLWHGANWTFVVWGLLHGVLMVLSVWISHFKRLTAWSSQLPGWMSAALQIFVTFHLVTLSWIFFRAESLSDAFYILTHLSTGMNSQLSVIEQIGGRYELLIAALALLLMAWIHWQESVKGSLRNVMLQQPLWLRWLAYYALVVSILMFGKLGTTEFIYFQF